MSRAELRETVNAMEDTPQKYQRRTILVKRALQFKYVALVFFTSLLVALLADFDVYYTIAKMALSDNPALATPISHLYVAFAIKMFLYLFLIILTGIYISHRFAGPIHRFEKSAQIAASGDLSHRVALRTGDELHELQEEFNGMMSSIQSLIQKDRNLAQRLTEKIEAISQKLSDSAVDEELKDELSSIKIELQHLTRAFKI
jgi:methyl-accepting chemotaxis protein